VKIYQVKKGYLRNFAAASRYIMYKGQTRAHYRDCIMRVCRNRVRLLLQHGAPEMQQSSVFIVSLLCLHVAQSCSLYLFLLQQHLHSLSRLLALFEGCAQIHFICNIYITMMRTAAMPCDAAKNHFVPALPFSR